MDDGRDGDEGDSTKLILNANVLGSAVAFFLSCFSHFRSFIWFCGRERAGGHGKRHKYIINCIQRLSLSYSVDIISHAHTVLMWFSPFRSRPKLLFACSIWRLRQTKSHVHICFFFFFSFSIRSFSLSTSTTTPTMFFTTGTWAHVISSVCESAKGWKCETKFQTDVATTATNKHSITCSPFAHKIQVPICKRCYIDGKEACAMSMRYSRLIQKCTAIDTRARCTWHWYCYMYTYLSDSAYRVHAKMAKVLLRVFHWYKSIYEKLVS